MLATILTFAALHAAQPPPSPPRTPDTRETATRPGRSDGIRGGDTLRDDRDDDARTGVAQAVIPMSIDADEAELEPAYDGFAGSGDHDLWLWRTEQAVPDSAEPTPGI